MYMDITVSQYTFTIIHVYVVYSSSIRSQEWSWTPDSIVHAVLTWVLLHMVKPPPPVQLHRYLLPLLQWLVRSVNCHAPSTLYLGNLGIVNLHVHVYTHNLHFCLLFCCTTPLGSSWAWLTTLAAVLYIYIWYVTAYVYINASIYLLLTFPRSQGFVKDKKSKLLHDAQSRGLYTWPPPSGNKMVSFSTTSKPSLASTHDTTLVVKSVR